MAPPKQHNVETLGFCGVAGALESIFGIFGRDTVSIILLLHLYH